MTPFEFWHLTQDQSIYLQKQTGEKDGKNNNEDIQFNSLQQNVCK